MLLNLALLLSFASLIFADYARLDVNNTAFLFVDHQTGLFQLVEDYEQHNFKETILALGRTAKYFKTPAVLTTSFEQGPNGPMMPELKAMFPNASYIPRPGQINAWDNADFVAAVKATGKKQLVISGIVTDVCVTFCALSAKAAGYEVFVVTDASGTFRDDVRYASWDRMSQAGVQLLNWFAVAAELGRDWRRDMEGMGELFSSNIPRYEFLMDSFNAAKNGSSH
ncbi:isochorismatase hydrolase [Hesseltinella vesiculosa]|uniref:Isochorismatase hydrolase n=1 Tax=Hesseltinella vesiculosa TaxID=101127 RepID=A0A1X2GEK9_9FUNG|nr:isochorismatase hydrolase [Hesseltinella vesiculosa]